VPIVEHTAPPYVKVEAGEVVSVLGAPGSGKTRLALELAFLSRPAAGEVLFRGENPMPRLHRLQMPKRPREVTMLVQNAEDQLFARTVFDDVAFGPRRLLLPGFEVESRVMRALRAVRLDAFDVMGRSPFALSGGERRRVALAGVLAMEPEVLILDEPTANLDPKTRDEFLDLLDPLRGKSAIVWLTSSAREAALAHRIYLLRNGDSALISGGDNLYEDWHALAAAGIELPGVYELATALERRGRIFPNIGAPDELRRKIIEDWEGRRLDR
jgi:energy-coupling factor transporter ATP-binding protein EcfA2